MVVKRVLRPERLRRVPKHFSWVDHRLVRDGHIKRCGPEALALYLLLVTVGDADGLSYYSDRVASRLLSLDESGVRQARRELLAADLISYETPLYQVLGLERASMPVLRTERGNGCATIGEVLQKAIGGQG